MMTSVELQDKGQKNEAYKEIENIISAMLGRLLYANSSIHIFESVVSRMDLDADVLKKDFNFWMVVLDNCIFRALTELAKIYDEQRDAVGIRKVINKASLLDIADIGSTINVCSQKYDNLETLRNKLKWLRDKGLAHADKQFITNLKSLTNSYGLNLEEIKTLIKSACDILNDILFCVANKRKSIDLILNDDAKHIIDDLKKLREMESINMFRNGD